MPEEDAVSKLKAEKDKILSQITAMQGELRGLDRAIAILNPTAEPEKQKRMRRGNLKETVIDYARADLENGVTADEIVLKADAQGTTLNKISVQSFLSKNRDIFFLENGRYRLKI